MFRKIFFFISLFLFIIFQVFFINNIFPDQIAPNLILLLIIFWTIKAGFEKTLKIVIFSGIVLDIFYFWPIGTNIFSLVMVSFLTSFLTKRFLAADFFSRSIWVIVVISFSIVINELLNQAIFNVIYFFKKTEFDFSINWMIWKKIISNIVVFAIIFWPFKKIESLVSLYGLKKNQKYYVK